MEAFRNLFQSVLAFGVPRDADDNAPLFDMTVQIASDIHLENFRGPIDFFSIITPTADVLALVGDIGTTYCSFLPVFLHWCSQHFKFVLFVPGNHEYYSRIGESMSVIDAKYERMVAPFDNVIYMNNKRITIGDVMFIGSTLWSYIPQEAETEVTELVVDYKYIYYKSDLITPKDINHLHRKNIAFIIESLAHSETVKTRAVVLTHHPPARDGTSSPLYATKEYENTNYAFASDIRDTFLPLKPIVWIAGHTHHNFDFRPHENGYNLVSNQRGYPLSPSPDYKTNCVINLDRLKSPKTI